MWLPPLLLLHLHLFQRSRVGFSQSYSVVAELDGVDGDEAARRGGTAPIVPKIDPPLE